MADGTPGIDTPKVREMSDGIRADIPPILEKTNPIFPELRELDPKLMVSVQWSLAAAHALAVGYTIEMIAGAADCFTQLTTALDESVIAWEQADEAAAKLLGGGPA